MPEDRSDVAYKAQLARMLHGAQISSQPHSLTQALKQAAQLYTGSQTPMESGLETTVFTEPIKDYVANIRAPEGTPAAIAKPVEWGAKFASGFIPGNRGEAIMAGANAALPAASAFRGPQIVSPGATAADDLIKVFRWGDKSLAPGNWVEAASSNKPLSYLLSTKWAPSVGGSRFAGYGSGAEHVVRRGDLAGASGLGSWLANALGQRRFAPAP